MSLPNLCCGVNYLEAAIAFNKIIIGDLVNIVILLVINLMIVTLQLIPNPILDKTDFLKYNSIIVSIIYTFAFINYIIFKSRLKTSFIQGKFLRRT